jgi:phage-related protein
VADEKKLKVDIGSIEDAGQKLGQSIGKGINKGVEDAANNLNSSELRKKLNETFSLRGLKENLVGSIKDGLAGTEKGVAKQKKMQEILTKNATLSKTFTSAIAGGASKGEILQKGLALASNNIKGMVANINPYVAAFTVAVKLSQAFLKSFQATLETSRKFVGQNSLFTDQATMQMMQRTGQSATGAQGTQRALDRLGISFDDIQSGRVTQAQMRAFEELRKMETARLEEIARVGGPVFEAMQRSALAMATTKQIIDDAITLVFAKSQGVVNFANQLEGTATNIGKLVWAAADIIAPFVNIIAGLLGSIIGVINMIVKYVSATVQLVAPIFDAINDVINVVFEFTNGFMSIMNRLSDAVLKPIMKIAKIVIGQIVLPIKIAAEMLSAFVDAIFVALEPIIQIFEIVFGVISNMIPVFNAFEKLSPILNVVTNAIRWMGEGIAWLLKKVFEGLAWMQTKVWNFTDWAINLIPEAVHNMVNYVIGLLNKIPGVNLDNLGDYQGISIGNTLDNLGLGLDSMLDKMTGDTINYNYGSTSTSGPASNANVNLFANMYTLVND